MGKFINEFKEFAVKGNAVDMAVGVIIGGAFGKIVSSIVDDIIMPPIGWLIGGVNFTDLKIHFLQKKLLARCFLQQLLITVILSKPHSTLSLLPSASLCW